LSGRHPNGSCANRRVTTSRGTMPSQPAPSTPAIVLDHPAREHSTVGLDALSGDLQAEAIQAAERGKAGAEHYGLSWPIAHAAFVAHVDPVLAQPLPPVKVLGIDETRRGKVQWGQDPDTGRWFVLADRWHTGIVDAAGTGGLLGHIDGRTAAKVAEWIAEQPDSWRAGITHVTIDLSASYLRAVTDALPHAVVVADRFHLVRLANDMVTEVRQRATREVRGRRGRRRDPEWAGRRKLLIAHERLDDAAFVKVWNNLIDAGDPGIEILHAYTVKENLRALLALSATFPERALIRARLWRLYEQAAASSSPEVHRFAATIEQWWQRSRPRSPPTTPTPDPRATTASRSTQDATRSATATSSTTAAPYAGPVLVNTDEPQLRSARCPVKFDEPRTWSGQGKSKVASGHVEVFPDGQCENFHPAKASTPTPRTDAPTALKSGPTPSTVKSLHRCPAGRDDA
jgi:hypothetical protein